MILGKILVARIKPNTHGDIIDNYNKIKNMIGPVNAFINPCYIDPVTAEKKYILPWYFFVEVLKDINIIDWERNDKNIFYFLRSKESDIINVDPVDFMKFLDKAMDYIMIKSHAKVDYIKGRKVRITSGIFRDYEGIIQKATLKGYYVKLDTKIPVTICLTGNDIVPL